MNARSSSLALRFARPAPYQFERIEADFDVAGNGCHRFESAITFECGTYSRHQKGDNDAGRPTQSATSQGGMLNINTRDLNLLQVFQAI